MLELWTMLAGFAEAMTIVGGSAPPLLIDDRPDDPYVGTLDVDLVVDPIGVPDEVYRTIAELLRERGYVQLDQPFRWLRSVTVDGRSIDVEVDLLARLRREPGLVIATSGSVASRWRVERRAPSLSGAPASVASSKACCRMAVETESPSASPHRQPW